jgi:hypothetical protein
VRGHFLDFRKKVSAALSFHKSKHTDLSLFELGIFPHAFTREEIITVSLFGRNHHCIFFNWVQLIGLD